MMGPALTTAAPRLIGRYLVFGEIASGGMATVHYGRMTGSVGFARTVAVKRLHPQFAKDPEFVTMFLDEARVAGRIRHPNVVPTLDVVATEGEIFLAMEYVQGESLSKLLKMARDKGRPPSPQIVATIIANLLHGLHAAHEAKDEHGRPLGIVHRDVSPQNVLVGADGVARVLDFGVAKAAGRLQTTREGQVKGKLSYMSPEQLNGGSVTRLADIYAAAVVLWETLTQERLFDGDNEAMTLVRVLEGKVDPPSRWVPILPPGTDEVVLRGLAQDPTTRFQTAREFAVAIERTMGLASPAVVGEWVESVATQELAEQTGLGEVYLSVLLRAQLRLSLAILLGTGVVVLGLPALFAFAPGTRDIRAGPVPLPWLAIGVLIYPLVVVAARIYVRQTERIEREFSELMKTGPTAP